MFSYISVCLFNGGGGLICSSFSTWGTQPAPVLAPKTWTYLGTWGPRFRGPVRKREVGFRLKGLLVGSLVFTVIFVKRARSLLCQQYHQTWDSHHSSKHRNERQNLIQNLTQQDTWTWWRFHLINNYLQDVPANFKSNIQLNLSNVNWAFHLRIDWPLSKNLPKDTDYFGHLVV